MSDQPTKRRRFVPRYTLRFLLVLMTIVACGFGWVKWKTSQLRAEWEDEQEVLDILEKSQGVYLSGATVVPTGPGWLRNTWPREEIFDQIRRVIISLRHFDLDPEMIPQLATLRHMDRLQISVASAELAQIEKEESDFRDDRRPQWISPNSPEGEKYDEERKRVELRIKKQKAEMTHLCEKRVEELRQVLRARLPTPEDIIVSYHAGAIPETFYSSRFHGQRRVSSDQHEDSLRRKK